MSTARRSFTATMLAFLLVAVGVFSIWMLTGSGVFASSSPVLDGPLPVSAGAATAGAGADAGLPLAASVQVAQPRDPFAPLTSEPPVTSSTLPGQTTTRKAEQGLLAARIPQRELIDSEKQCLKGSSDEHRNQESRSSAGGAYPDRNALYAISGLVGSRIIGIPSSSNPSNTGCVTLSCSSIANAPVNAISGNFVITFLTGVGNFGAAAAALATTVLIEAGT